MPRNGRIRLVGKIEAREREAREDELRELARQLRRQWRLWREVASGPERTADAADGTQQDD